MPLPCSRQEGPRDVNKPADQLCFLDLAELDRLLGYRVELVRSGERGRISRVVVLGDEGGVGRKGLIDACAGSAWERAEEARTDVGYFETGEVQRVDHSELLGAEKSVCDACGVRVHVLGAHLRIDQ